jgi:hypothetical protein
MRKQLKMSLSKRSLFKNMRSLCKNNKRSLCKNMRSLLKKQRSSNKTKNKSKILSILQKKMKKS